MIVPVIENQIQQEAAQYIGSTLGGYVTLDRLNSACGLTSIQIPILGIPIKSVVQATIPGIVEKCNQLATLLQILSFEIYIYAFGFLLLVLGLVLGGGKREIIREVVREKAHKEEESEEEPEEEEQEKEETKSKKGKSKVKYCSECGSENNTGDKFCKDCGKKLK